MQTKMWTFCHPKNLFLFAILTFPCPLPYSLHSFHACDGVLL
jgi:hypothetical protein